MKKEVEEQTKRLSTKRNIIVLIVIGTILISAVSYFAVVQRQLAQVGPGELFDIDDINRRVEEKENYLADLKKIKDNIESIDQEDLEILSGIIPTGKDIPELLSQLEAISRQSGVDLISVRFSEVEENSQTTVRQRLKGQEAQAATKKMSVNVQSLGVRLEFSAYTYPRFKNFMEALQTHIRLFDLKTFSYDTERDVHNLTLDTYYIAE